jgi:hypothetical protein
MIPKFDIDISDEMVRIFMEAGLTGQLMAIFFLAVAFAGFGFLILCFKATSLLKIRLEILKEKRLMQNSASDKNTNNP